MVVTNYLGAVFTATLLSVSERGATFVFPEDGATNTLAFSKLSSESSEAVCRAKGFIRVPPEISATFDRVKSDLKRVDDLLADKRLSVDKAAERRERVLTTFRGICSQKGISCERTEALVWKLGVSLIGQHFCTNATYSVRAPD